MAFYKENQINPAASCLPMLAQFPVFIGLFFVLRDFEEELIASHGSQELDWLGLVNITEDTKVGWGPLLIVLYAISQLTSSYLMSQNMQPAQRAMLLILPIAFIPFVLNFPSGLMLYWLTTNLWTTGQGLVTRRLVPKPQPPPKRSSRTPPKDAPPPEPEPEAGPTAEGRAAEPAGARTRRRVRKVKRKKRRLEAVSEISVEMTGETVGEAKWAALRELERMRPGLDKAAVRFQVVTEGERGLLGVGYEPARVVASVDEEAAPAREGATSSPRRARATTRRVCARSSSGSRDEIGVHCTVEIEESDEEIRVVCDGHDLGMLIGRHGQTIDAIQYLANAILFRGRYEERKPVVVDAAGYRDRRQATLDALALRMAEQASATGQRVELEPMTAVERKIVHEKLKDDPEVETASEGTEPNRFVVIIPAPRRASRPPRPLARGGCRDAGADRAEAIPPRRGACSSTTRSRASSSSGASTARSSTSAAAAARPGSRSPRRCRTAR